MHGYVILPRHAIFGSLGASEHELIPHQFSGTPEESVFAARDRCPTSANRFPHNVFHHLAPSRVLPSFQPVTINNTLQPRGNWIRDLPCDHAQGTLRSSKMATQVYTSAIALAISSLLVTLLIIPPMCWHFRNRNLGATVLVAWIIYLNFQSFVNALIWSHDDISSWFHGVGLCDIEVKLEVASQVAAPAALCCVLRALAKVLDTDRITTMQSKAQIRKDTAIDITICVVPAVLQMAFHFIVQPERFYILGISGCVPAVSPTWVTVLLIYIPPVIWVLIDAYFSSKAIFPSPTSGLVVELT
nr:pheromone a factor receptor [Quercus suber]